MAETFKVLGQLDMPASSITNIYIVPPATTAVVSTLYVCNTQGSTAYFSWMIAVGGAADDASQRLYYNVAIPAYETFASTTGITLGAGDEVRGYASATGLTFQLFGVEKT